MVLTHTYSHHHARSPRHARMPPGYGGIDSRCGAHPGRAARNARPLAIIQGQPQHRPEASGPSRRRPRSRNAAALMAWASTTSRNARAPRWQQRSRNAAARPPGRWGKASSNERRVDAAPCRVPAAWWLAHSRYQRPRAYLLRASAVRCQTDVRWPGRIVVQGLVPPASSARSGQRALGQNFVILFFKTALLTRSFRTLSSYLLSSANRPVI